MPHKFNLSLSIWGDDTVKKGKILKDAIRDKRVLSITYESMTRVIEPHLLGISTAGNPVLRAYQIGGNTRTELGWKLFLLEEIDPFIFPLDIVSEAPREDFNPDDKAMITIIYGLRV